MNLQQYEQLVQVLYDEDDALVERRGEIAAEIDRLTFECYKSGNRVHDMAQVWNVVPEAIRVRIRREKERERDRVSQRNGE